MKSQLIAFSKIILISLIPTLLVWVPFFFRLETFWGIPLPREGMATIAANYDGPLYIAVAKTFYDQEKISGLPFSLPSEYYAAHFPLYPTLIKLFASVAGYPYSMLLVTLLSSILTLWFFYKLTEEFVDKKNALWITFIFSIFPARWLIVRSIGSPEPLFLAGIIASIYYFKNSRYVLAGIWGAIAQFTKSPGILIFIAYTFAIGIPTFQKLATKSNKINLFIELKKYWGILLIPLSLLFIFYIYKIQMNDFWAYFNSGDNIHLFFPPFQIFNYAAPWVGTFWLEEIIFVYLFGAIGITKLIKLDDKILAWIIGIFFMSTLFISHRDLIRYSLPITPFIILSFAKQITNKDYRWIVLLLLLPIYLFSIVFISQNTMPISNWAPLL